MTVLVETEEFTIESLELVPKGTVYVCPECGGPKILRHNKRCKKCQSKHALKKAWKTTRKNKK